MKHLKNPAPTTLAEIQAEVVEWSCYNFGYQDIRNPILGMVEELGELCEAESREEALDAIADIAIYLCDYAGRRRITIDESVAAAEVQALPALVISLGRLCHAVLKQSQGIRGHENHVAAERREASRIWAGLRLAADLHDVDLLKQVARTWAIVRTRDWKAKPETAAESAS